MFNRSILAVAAIAFASFGALAASNSPLHGARGDSATSGGGTHKLVNVTENWATAAGIGLVAGFNNLDNPTTVKCGNSGGCTIISEAEVQIAPGSGALWAICMLVDGNYANPGCPYQGTLPGAGSYLTGNARTNFAVAFGSHTVQTQVYVSVASTLGEWQSDYGVYKP